jgi:hypothetical protein
MALVELRRFYDRNEAYIARSMLGHAGILSMVRDNGYANMFFGTAIATGGYGLFVEPGDVETARGLLLEAVPLDAEALAWTQHPQRIASLPSALLGTVAGWAIGAPTLIGSSRRPTLTLWIGTAVALLVLLSLAWAFVTAALHPDI